MKALEAFWKGAVSIVPMAAVWFFLMWSVMYLNQCQSSFMHECVQHKPLDECRSDYAELNK